MAFNVLFFGPERGWAALDVMYRSLGEHRVNSIYDAAHLRAGQVNSIDFGLVPPVSSFWTDPAVVAAFHRSTEEHRNTTLLMGLCNPIHVPLEMVEAADYIALSAGVSPTYYYRVLPSRLWGTLMSMYKEHMVLGEHYALYSRVDSALRLIELNKASLSSAFYSFFFCGCTLPIPPLQ